MNLSRTGPWRVPSVHPRVCPGRKVVSVAAPATEPPGPAESPGSPGTPGSLGSPGLRLSTPAGRWVVTATVLGSGMAALDATVVGIALPAIGRNFHASVASVQWGVDAYTLTLAGLLLLGGTLGDSYGRRRMFVIGTVWFAVASLLCGLALNAPMLIAARALQG